MLNPAQIWLLAILIAAVSFAGYIAVRVFGDRKGIAVAAIAGGMASSTATTLAFARLARGQPASARLLAGGILLAGVTMLARIVVLAGLLKPVLLPAILWPAAAAAAVLLVGAGTLLWRRQGAATEHPHLQIKNPFDLGTVLQLAGLIAVIMLVAKTLAREAVHIARHAVPVAVLEGPHKEASMTLGRNEDFSIASFRSAFGCKNVGGVAHAEPEAIIAPRNAR